MTRLKRLRTVLFFANFTTAPSRPTSQFTATTHRESTNTKYSCIAHDQPLKWLKVHQYLVSSNQRKLEKTKAGYAWWRLGWNMVWQASESRVAVLTRCGINDLTASVKPCSKIHIHISQNWMAVVYFNIVLSMSSSWAVSGCVAIFRNDFDTTSLSDSFMPDSSVPMHVCKSERRNNSYFNKLKIMADADNNITDESKNTFISTTSKLDYFSSYILWSLQSRYK
jgi:hypothetical protein